MIRRIILLLILVLTVTVSPAKAEEPSLDVMVGQMLMAGFRGFEAGDASPVARDIRDYHLGGVILFDYDVVLGRYERNIESPEQVLKLTSAVKSYAEIPLFVAVDQEGGKVQRLKPKYGFPDFPSAEAVGKMDDAQVAATAMKFGYTVSKYGFNMNFAPVADVNVNPDSPAIGAIGRSFSADPKRVIECDSIYLEEFARQGVIGCLKHFPGHGSAGADSHEGLTDVTETWREEEGYVYAELIKTGLPKMIMTAHIFNAKLDSKYPATLSFIMVDGILRDLMGYDGVVVSDDMTMRAITKYYGLRDSIRLAIQAGVDILLFGNNIDYDRDIVPKAHGIIMQLVKDGVISKERVAQSYARIMRLKKDLK